MTLSSSTSGASHRLLLNTFDRLSLAYFTLLALAAVDSIGYSVIGPVLPALAKTAHVDPLVAGIIVAGFPFGMIFGFAVAGSTVRRFGARATLFGALFLVAGGTIGFIMADSTAGYLASRAVMGLGSGGLWLGITFSTLERWPGQEYRCMSRILAAYSAGALGGPALGALGGVRTPFVAYLVFVAAGFALATVLPAAAERRTFASDRVELRRPRFWVAVVAIMLAMLGTGLIDGALPLHFSTKLTQAEIGGCFAGLAIIVAFASVGAGHLRPRWATALGAVLLVVGIELSGATTTVGSWLPALGIVGAGIGMGQTGATGLLLDTVPTERIVSAMVVWSQMAILGYLIAPVAGGALGQALGYRSLGIAPAAMAVLLVATTVFARYRRIRPSS